MKDNLCMYISVRDDVHAQKKLCHLECKRQKEIITRERRNVVEDRSLHRTTLKESMLFSFLVT